MSGEKTPMTDPSTRDAEYAQRFWSGSRPQGTREAMARNILSAAEKRRFSLFVSAEGFSDDDKAKMSAYRTLAREMGYDIGPITLDRKTGTASAEVRKI